MRLFFGVLFIVIGVLVFTGTFSWDIFANMSENFFRVWPVIFVFIGLSVLAKVKGLKWLRHVHSIFLVFFLLYMIFWPSDAVYSQQFFELPISVPLSDSFDSFSIDISGSAYEIILEDATDTSINEIQGVMISRKEKLKIETFHNIVSFRLEESNPLFFFKPEINTIKLLLPVRNSYQLISTGGVVTAKITLTNASLKILDIKSGYIKVFADFGKVNTPLQIWMESGAIFADMFFPAGTTYFGKTEGGIKNITVSDQLLESFTNPLINYRVNSGFMNFNLLSHPKED